MGARIETYMFCWHQQNTEEIKGMYFIVHPFVVYRRNIVNCKKYFRNIINTKNILQSKKGVVSL